MGIIILSGMFLMGQDSPYQWGQGTPCGPEHFEGLWLNHPDPPVLVDAGGYFESDGLGTITDAGYFHAADPPGSYVATGCCETDCRLDLVFRSTHDPDVVANDIPLPCPVTNAFNQIRLVGSKNTGDFSGAYFVDEDDIPPILSGDITLAICP
jgi:hypothetical protein